MNIKFGTKLRLKKDWNIDSSRTFPKGTVFRVVNTARENQIGLMVSKAGRTVWFSFYPLEKGLRLSEYFKIVE